MKIGLSPWQERDLIASNTRQKSKLGHIFSPDRRIETPRQPTDSPRRPLSNELLIEPLGPTFCRSIHLQGSPLGQISCQVNQTVLSPLERGERALSDGGLHPARIRPGTEISPDEYLRATRPRLESQFNFTADANSSNRRNNIHHRRSNIQLPTRCQLITTHSC